jgi:glyoxylase-like metal-dependent hydrolase (beta-lactamase superfamily II)
MTTAGALKRAGRHLTALAILAPLFSSPLAAQAPQQIGENLYAFISANDASANASFLVTREGILLVDSGLNEAEGRKLLAAIRSVSDQPVRYLINTHDHPDHQGANAAMGPEAVVISTPYTRSRTLDLEKHSPSGVTLRPAAVTFGRGLTIHIEGYTVEVRYSGPAHTKGDAMVYFRQQRVWALGDLFLNHCSPAMDEGSAENWVKALDIALATPAEQFVPGHFEIGARDDVKLFRDYLADLVAQVRAGIARGAPLARIQQQLKIEKYKSFRQYPKYEATFADNAAAIYGQLSKK